MSASAIKLWSRVLMNTTLAADTVTSPTKAMFEYGSLSSLGDDHYHEPTTASLEAKIALLTGKDAALFLPSGVMSNQIALRAHLTQPPYSVLYDARSHIHLHEAGGAAFHSGAQGIAVLPQNRR